MADSDENQIHGENKNRHLLGGNRGGNGGGGVFYAFPRLYMAGEMDIYDTIIGYF